MANYGQNNRAAGFFGIGQQPFDSYMQPVVPNYPDQYGTSGQTQSALQNLMAQRQIEGQQTLNNYDPEDEDSVNALQRLMAIGQVPATTGNALLRQSRYYNPVQKNGSTTGRYSPYSDEGTQALNELNSIDPTDPASFQQMGQIIQKYPGASSDPRFISSVHQLRRDLLTYKPQRQQDPTKTVEYQLASAGYDPTTFDQYRDENGQIPPVTAAYLISKSKSQRPLSSQEHMGLVQAYRGLQSPPSDDDKVDAANQRLGTNYTKETLPKELWTPSYGWAQNKKVQGLTDMIGALHSSGARLPANLGESADALEFPSGGRQFSRIPGQPQAGQNAPASPQTPSRGTPQLPQELLPRRCGNAPTAADHHSRGTSRQLAIPKHSKSLVPRDPNQSFAQRMATEQQAAQQAAQIAAREQPANEAFTHEKTGLEQQAQAVWIEVMQI